MKFPKLKFNSKTDPGESEGDVKPEDDVKPEGDVKSKRALLERLNPFVLMAGGAVSMILLAVLMFAGGTSQQENMDTLERARLTMSEVSGIVQNVRRLMLDQQVQDLAAIAAADPDELPNLQQYVSGRIPGMIELELFDTDLDRLRAADLGPYGFVVLDMLITAGETGLAPAQLHGKGADAYMTMAVRIGDDVSPAGYLLVKVTSQPLTSAFDASMSEPGEFALSQYNGRFESNKLRGLGLAPDPDEHVVWLGISGSLFRVGVVQASGASGSLDILRPVFFILGLILLVFGAVLKLRPYKPPEELIEDPVQIESLSEADVLESNLPGLNEERPL